MWKVDFSGVEIFTSQNDVEAIQFALALHQSSNLEHTIQVSKTHDPLITGLPDEVVCTLYKAPK